MLKRVPLTALALGMLWAGLAQAQLFIDDSAPKPVVQAPKATPPRPVDSVSSSNQPTRGLVIIDGYDQPATPSAVVVAQAPRPVEGRVVETGTRPAKVASMDGWADAVPLSVALAQIVPHEFNVDSAGLDAGSRKVNWSGNHRAWPEVLGALAKAQRLVITLNWTDRRVTVRSADKVELGLASQDPASSTGSTAPAVAQASVEKATVEKATTVTTTRTTTVVEAKPAVVQTPVVRSAPVEVRPVVQAAPTVQTWRLDASKSLKQNVEDWARQAGWNRVVWDGADYPIAAPAVFSGRFDAEDGPLSQLIAGFADSDQPLLVRLTLQDRVVHIVNKNYTPAQVDSVAPQELAPATFNLSGNGNKSERAEAAADTAADAQSIQSGSQMAPLRIDDRGTRAARH